MPKIVGSATVATMLGVTQVDRVVKLEPSVITTLISW